MKVLLAGGGTAGHINPALAIASVIKEHYPDTEFLFVGTPNGMEARLIPEAGYNFASMKVAGFQRKLTPKNIKRNFQAAGYLMTSGPKAKKIISDFKPDIAIGTGGYVSGPIIKKAARMGVATAIHEQNAFPGVTNKLLAKEVDKVMLTVKEALKYLDKDVDYVVTGLPVRDGIASKSKLEARAELGFDNELCILSFGGSLGAGCINETMAEVINWHTKNNLKINHIHGYGKMGRESFPEAMKQKGIAMKSDRLRITEYINDMDTCLAAADLVICRSGASTLAELEAAGKASILIPSPNVVRNHQEQNAREFENKNAAELILEKDLTSDALYDKIMSMVSDKERLKEMSENLKPLAKVDALKKIYELMIKMAKGDRK